MALQETKIILPTSEVGLRDLRLSDNSHCILSTAEAGLNGHGVSGGLGFLISPRNAGAMITEIKKIHKRILYVKWVFVFIGVRLMYARLNYL